MENEIILVGEIKKAGLDDIHNAFIELDDTLQSQINKMGISKSDEVFNEFNSIFHI
jgi:hypothetical protein